MVERTESSVFRSGCVRFGIITASWKTACHISVGEDAAVPHQAVLQNPLIQDQLGVLSLEETDKDVCITHGPHASLCRMERTLVGRS